jgi:signal transduction histidine kinase/CHASE3 domain sensor protein
MGRNFLDALVAWWGRLSIQRKVTCILAATFVPLICAFLFHLGLIEHLSRLQEHRHQIVLAREQIHILRRLAVDIEDAFRGYLLTRQDRFLSPLNEAESKLDGTIAQAVDLGKDFPGLDADLRVAGRQLKTLLASKHELINKIRAGQVEEANRYVASGEGLALSDRVRDLLRSMEDRLHKLGATLSTDEESLATKALLGLAVALLATIGLGLLGARLMARSVTDPLALLHSSVVRQGRRLPPLPGLPISSNQRLDEIGDLGRVYEGMVQHLRQYVLELEAIISIGHEISTLGPDGIEGVLHRITNRAVELLKVDVCLVLIRQEQMGCWVVESASGEWNDRLRKTVMLWEEWPVSVRAFDTKEPAVGANLSHDQGPSVARRNQIGESLLAVPLLSRGESFGVLVLIHAQSYPEEAWNLRLARGLAEEAAIAIANARLYEQAHERSQGLQVRLKQLEHLAETLAHDLKAPGERMEELASLLLTEYRDKLDERGTRWLKLISDNGKDLSGRVEKILEVARVGGRRDKVEAVDPAAVIEGVLKARAGDLEDRKVRVQVQSDFPLVACHRAYLAQVFDNLISNAVKFAGGQEHPVIRIAAERRGEGVHFSVSDNGPGIPSHQRERVFEPFVRLAPTSAKGSGIGLTIVQRIVELYGGRVWIESAEPGCRVLFSMPVLGELAGTGT